MKANRTMLINYLRNELDVVNRINCLYIEVAKLSNYSIAYALMQTVKEIACNKMEPNSETICKYLNYAIKDLSGGMDATDMLCKYDMILFDIKYGHRTDEDRGI